MWKSNHFFLVKNHVTLRYIIRVLQRLILDFILGYMMPGCQNTLE